MFMKVVWVFPGECLMVLKAPGRLLSVLVDWIEFQGGVVSSMVSGVYESVQCVPGKVHMSSGLFLEVPECVWSVWKSSGELQGVIECSGKFTGMYGRS